MKKHTKHFLALFLSLTMLLCSSCGTTPAGEEQEAPAPVEEEQEAPDTNSQPDAEANESTAPAAAGEYEAFDNYPHPVVKTDGSLTIGFVSDKPEFESIQRILQQLRLECTHRGWDLVEVVYESEQDLRDKILNLINQNVDVILNFSLTNMDSKQDLVAQARNAGIGWYNMDTQVVDGVISNSAMPDGLAGATLMYAIGEKSKWNEGLAVITKKSIQVHYERTDVMSAIANCYSTASVLSEQDIAAVTYDELQAANDFAKTWVTQYGDQLTGIITSTDYFGVPVAEALNQAGVDNVWVSGFDGGSETWAYIRNNTPLQYSYAVPDELFVHMALEVIDDIQVEGMNPGDEGCTISHVGEIMYCEGIVIDRDNCPAVGTNIHAVFDYYGGDPDDADAWYNWNDGDGAYVVTDYVAE